jgi:hypothetical protein
LLGACGVAAGLLPALAVLARGLPNSELACGLAELKLLHGPTDTAQSLVRLPPGLPARLPRLSLPGSLRPQRPLLPELLAMGVALPPWPEGTKLEVAAGWCGA